MKLSLILIVALAASCTALRAQNVTFAPPQPAPVSSSVQQDADAVLSVQGRRLQSALKDLGRDVRRKDTSLIEEYGLVRIGRRYHVRALVRVGADFEEAFLKKYRVQAGSRTGHFLSVSIPTRKFAAFAESGIVEYVEVATPMIPVMH